MRWLLLSLPGGLAATLAWAQTAPPPAPPPLPGDPARYLLQALLSLAFVVALIYGAYWLLRRSGFGRGMGESEGPATLVQSLPLQTGATLHVVEIGGRRRGIVCGTGGVTSFDAGAAPEAGDEEDAS